MENAGALAVLVLLVAGVAALWLVNRAGTRAGLPVDVPSRPRRVEGRPVERPGVGGDTFTAAGDELTGRDEPARAPGDEAAPVQGDGQAVEVRAGRPAAAGAAGAAPAAPGTSTAPSGTTGRGATEREAGKSGGEDRP